MYNLPKFESEKAAKNLSKTYQSRYVQNWRALPKLMAGENRCNGRRQHRTSFQPSFNRSQSHDSQSMH